MNPDLKMDKWKRRVPALLLAVIVAAASSGFALAQQPAKDLSKLPARPARAWVRDSVIYQIFPRAFSAEGNFNGITAQLDRLKELGVTIIWLMPIHPIGQEKKKGTIGSPYAVRDYYGINPDYGTKEDLKKLISESHRRGLKMIIDIVANHTAWDSVLMKHPDWYKHDASCKITYPKPGRRNIKTGRGAHCTCASQTTTTNVARSRALASREPWRPLHSCLRWTACP